MPGVHDFTNYLKRGFGRASVQASMDVRQGLIDRNDAMALAEDIDKIEPYVLDYFLKITGYSREEFYQIMRERKLGPLKGVNVPVQEYDRERYREILPFVVDFIREIRNEYPTGDTRDSAEDTR